MDQNTFIVELVRALAWPVTALVIFLAVRRPLMRLLPHMQRVKLSELEIEFGEKVREVSAEVQRSLDAVPSLSRTTRQMRENWERLALQSPRAVVLESWLQVEDAAMEAARKANLGLTSKDLRAPKLLGEALEKANILDNGTAKIYHDLRNLRNAAAHATDPAIDSASALEYADSAIRLSEYLLSKA